MHKESLFDDIAGLFGQHPDPAPEASEVATDQPTANTSIAAAPLNAALPSLHATAHKQMQTITFVMTHLMNEGSHATMGLLDSLDCVNTESYECFDDHHFHRNDKNERTHDAHKQAAALTSFLTTPFASLPTTFMADYARLSPDVDDEKLKGCSRCCSRGVMLELVGKRFQGPSQCAAEARGSLIKVGMHDMPLHELPEICEGAHKLDVLFQMARTDLVRYSLANYDTMYDTHAHAQFGLAARKLEPHHYDIKKLQAVAWHGVAQWKYLRHQRLSVQAKCGIAVVPLEYETMNKSPLTFQSTVLQKALRDAADRKGVDHASGLFKPASGFNAAWFHNEDTSLRKVHSDEIIEIATNWREVEHLFGSGGFPSFADVYWAKEDAQEREHTEAMRAPRENERIADMLARFGGVPA